MAWFSSKVEVTFIDDATGESFGFTQMQPGDLPESFERDTTMHLADEDWSVVDADPQTRAEFAKTKTLTLRLRRIETMDPGSMLYSLPSFCDAIPQLGDRPLAGDEFVLAEDDWRQFELVSRKHAAVVDDEIEQIRQIHENSAAVVGWREVHVRTRPERPVAGLISLPDLADLLKVSSELVGVAYRGAETQIADGYAFHKEGLTIYGVAPGDRVEAIAVDPYSQTSPEADIIARLKSLARDSNLDLVHWCRCTRVDADDPSFVSLLAGDMT